MWHGECVHGCSALVMLVLLCGHSKPDAKLLEMVLFVSCNGKYLCLVLEKEIVRTLFQPLRWKSLF